MNAPIVNLDAMAGFSARTGSATCEVVRYSHQAISGKGRDRVWPRCGKAARYIWTPRNNPQGRMIVCESCGLGLAGNFKDELKVYSPTTRSAKMLVERNKNMADQRDTERQMDNRKPEREASFAASDCSAIRDFLSAIVEMTEGAADIDKRSIVKPGVTLKTEARRLLQRIERHSPNADLGQDAPLKPQS